MVTLKLVEIHLKTAGGMAEQARLSKQSLTAAERAYIESARTLAREEMLSESIIQAYLEEGAEQIRRNYPC